MPRNEHEEPKRPRKRRDADKRQEVDKAISPPHRVVQIHQPIKSFDEDRHRVSTTVEPDIQLALKQLSVVKKQSIPDLLRDAIDDFVVEAQEQSAVTPSNDKVVLRNPAEIMGFSRLLIEAAKDAIEYAESAVPGRNAPPPSFLPRDYTPEYVQELRRLVEELERLNKNLEVAVSATTASKRKRSTTRAAKDSAVDVKKHINTFLENYSKSLGKGAAALTIGTCSALLLRLGVPPEAFSALVNGLKR